MTTLATMIGAPSTRQLNWKLIKWDTVQKHVRRLQMRIAKATTKVAGQVTWLSKGVNRMKGIFHVRLLEGPMLVTASGYSANEVRDLPPGERSRISLNFLSFKKCTLPKDCLDLL